MTTLDGPFFMGVDGGGTRCRVRLRNRDGDELAYVEGGSANVHNDPEGALETIQLMLENAFNAAGLLPKNRSKTALGIGLAGIVSLVDANRIRSALSGFAHLVIESDAVAACIGAHHGADGGLVIAGTGSAGLALLNSKKTAISGRGFAISDEGSAARIGWEALRQSLLAVDDLGPSSQITQQIMKRFDNDPVAVTRWTALARSADYGALAPIVFGHAEKGDAVALPIIQQATRDILNLHAALRRLGCERIALVGGLSEPLKPWIELLAPYPFVPPLHDAADGALLMAGGKLP
jgi:glucosamine kinase